MNIGIKPRENDRFITCRSLVFSLVGIFLMSGLAGFHDSVLSTSFMIGCFLSPAAFFYFVFLALVWNGGVELLDRALKRGGAFADSLALGGREMAFVITATMVSCYPPTSGLFRYFHRMIMMPWYWLPGHLDWQEHRLLQDFIDPKLFPAPWPGDEALAGSAEYERVYTGFFTGLKQGTSTVGFIFGNPTIPLRAWIGPALHWSPMILLTCIAVVSMQFIVHRQWCQNEQLSYPLAQIIGEFAKGRKGLGRSGRVPEIFRNRLFWCGLVPVLLLFMMQYLSRFYPDSIPSLQSFVPNLMGWGVPLSSKVFPMLSKTWGYWSLDSQTFHFVFFAIAFFVSSEVALTVGVTQPLVVLFGLLYYQSTGKVIQEESLSFMNFGAALAYAVSLAYTGRNYYKAVFRNALGLKTHGVAPEASAVMAARILVVSTLGLWAAISLLCGSVVMGLLHAMLVLVLFLVVTRIVCDTGIPFIQAHWNVANVLKGLLGSAAIGPKALVFMNWGGRMLDQDPRECLMPYVATSLKVADDSGVRLKKVYFAVLVIVLVAIVVAFMSSLFSIYNYTPMLDSWAATYAPVGCFDASARAFHDMKVSGIFDASLNASSIERLRMISPDYSHLRFAIVGAIGIAIFSMLRFRFSRFPLHPVAFLIAGTYPEASIWSSFLMGAIVKMLVVRFGGGGVYQKVKPLFIGIIAGHLCASGITFAVDFLHYMIFGSPSPVRISFLPL